MTAEEKLKKVKKIVNGLNKDKTFYVPDKDNGMKIQVMHYVDVTVAKEKILALIDS